eukprot:CAMPEP_0194262902 /NCGR_PEP_ID=MMETSP0158-20130606/46783_1 /TAXON_ID=33649 /ORGANISM="Thalassionema nitzschioides, Strain L26-B" /LENGTH=149 /DNA_ID=CAMNT_0039003067 /DNA_START=448 /DNA_END=897 /DNA_ORIENTATION=-
MFVNDHDDHIRIAQENFANIHQPRQQQQPRPQRRDNGGTEAHMAAKMGQLDQLQQLSSSLSSSADIFHAQDANGWQPLHEAVRGGYLEIVNYLITAHQVDINARTNQNQGPSPLWLAESFHGLQHPVTVRLIELGAIKIGPGPTIQERQ